MGSLRRTYHLLCKSLYGKTITTLFILSSILSVYLYLEYRAVNHFAGESTSINLAGQLRYKAFKIGWLLHRLAETGHVKTPGKIQEDIINETRHEVESFDNTLSYLRNGSPSLALKPVHYEDAQAKLDRINEKWNESIKPVVLRGLETSGSVPGKNINSAISEYDRALQAFVTSIDRLAGLIVNNLETEITRSLRGHFYIFLMMLFSGLIILYTTRKNLIIPILELSRATKSLSAGNLDARVKIKTGNELETLGMTFNQMADKMKEILGEKTKLIKNLEGIQNATKAVLSDIDYETVLKEVIDEGRRLLDTRYAAIGILDSDGDYEAFFQAGLEEKVCKDLIKAYESPHEKGLLKYLIREKSPLILNNIREHPVSSGFPNGHPEMNTLLGVPIPLKDKVIGWLYFSQKRGGGIFTEEDELLALSYASTVAMVIKNARQIKDLQERKEEIETLTIASTNLINLDHREGVHQRICEIALEIFRLKMVWMGLIDEETLEIKPDFSSGYADGYLNNLKIRLDDSEYARGPTARAVKNRQPVAVNDIANDQDYSPWREAALRRGYRASLAVPLICTRDRCVGVLNLYSDQKGFFSQERIKIIQAFANQAATVIENVRLVENLDQIVQKRTDELEMANLELQQLNKELDMRKQEAEAATMMAESANRAKSDFLANMSHELRTPLNGILGFSEMLLMESAGPLTEKQREYLKNIYESGDHLLGLINDVLDLSKIEAGALEPEYSDVDVRSLAGESLLFIKEKALKHRITLSVDLPPEIPVIEGDRRRLKQVVVNLLSNAVKFTPDGGSITVTARKIRKSRLYDQRDIDCLEFSVKDTGPGIRAEDMARLFQPFQQLGDAYKKQEGTGLGLALCKKIIEAHGGVIDVESEYGRGSRFFFIIPTRKRTSTHYSLQKGTVNPLTGLLSCESLLRHLEWIESYHKQKDLQFGILRIVVQNVSEEEDWRALADLLKKTVRKHEIIGHAADKNELHIIVLNTTSQEIGNVAERFRKILEDYSYEIHISYVIFPDDGDNFSRLLARLESMKKG